MSHQDILFLIKMAIYLIVVITTLGIMEENMRLNLKLSKHKVLTVLKTVLTATILFYIGLVLLILEEGSEFLQFFICYDFITYVFVRIKRLEFLQKQIKVKE